MAVFVKSKKGLVHRSQGPVRGSDGRWRSHTLCRPEGLLPPMLFTHTSLNSSARAMGGRACKRCLVLQERRARGEAEALEDLAACEWRRERP
jgi:hypothetical protein